MRKNTTTKGRAKGRAEGEEAPARGRYDEHTRGRIERAFESRDEDPEAYRRAWEEYSALLRGLVEDENFYHVNIARRLLPGLLAARREIDGWEDASAAGQGARAAGTGPLERRAQAIVGDADRYDAGTRAAVRRALDDNADDLADLIKQAEEGADPIANNENPLTLEQVASAADELAGAESESAALLLLLCFAFSCEKEAHTRADMLHAVKVQIAPLLEGFEPAVEAALRGRLEALRGERGAA